MAFPKLYRGPWPFTVLVLALVLADPADARSGSSRSGASEVRCGKSACTYGSAYTKGTHRAGHKLKKTGSAGRGARPRYLLE